MDHETKQEMISILETLNYNTSSDLLTKLIKAKKTFNRETFCLLFYGDTPSDTISDLEKRWCLRKQIIYHRDNTGKISENDFQKIESLFTSHKEK